MINSIIVHPYQGRKYAFLQKERIFVKGDDMTNQEAQIKRAVKLALKREERKRSVKMMYRGVAYTKEVSELPKYITDNPFYP